MTTRPTTRRALSLALVLAAVGTAACGSRGGSRAADDTSPTPMRTATGGSRANMLTTEEIRRSNITNVFDLVSTLRPRWMQTRGSDSFQQPSVVQVYVDNTRLSAGLAGLRDLASLAVNRIEFVSPIDASARWGPRPRAGRDRRHDGHALTGAVRGRGRPHVRPPRSRRRVSAR
jgi:hypothetical protein